MNHQQEDHLERYAARLVARAVGSFPQLSAVFFSSPMCARSPDLSLVWHPGYRTSHPFRVYAALIWSLWTALPKGLARLLFRVRRGGYCRYGKVRDSILIVPEVCGDESPVGRFYSPYVATKSEDAVLVFGPWHKLGSARKVFNKIGLRRSLQIYGSLLVAGVLGVLTTKGLLKDRVMLLFMWVSWAVGGEWIVIHQLEVTLKEILLSERIQKVGCVHEMHGYSRLVWYVSERHGAITFTVQHASISAGKRWYFSQREELRAGLKLPQVFYMYNQHDRSLLKPWFPSSDLRLGCSQRYFGWKSCNPNENRNLTDYLFVGGLAKFDNEVVCNGLRLLISQGRQGRSIRLRLHPFAQLTHRQKRWLKVQVSNGEIQYSNSSLYADINKARVVVGMSTTALEEALFLDRPVVQIIDDQYRLFLNLEGVPGVESLPWRKLTWDLLDSSRPANTHEQFKVRLGLDKPLIDYERLFSTQ